MPDEQENTYKFLSRAYQVVKVIALASVSLAGLLVSAVALDIKISNRWVETTVPLYAIALVAVPTVVLFGIVVVVLALLLKDGLAALSYYRNKSKNLEAAVSQLQNIIYNDPITGIPNSNALERELKSSGHQNVCRCLILLDLQDFGKINKEHNHWKGDEYLRHFAEMVTTASRRNEFLFKKRPLSDQGPGNENPVAAEDDIRAFRKYAGGDEFFILLEGTIIDGLGYLNRLQKRAGEFEAMSLRVLGAKHTFGFHAGLIMVSLDESFESANKRASVCLGAALEKDYPSRLYWEKNALPEIKPDSIQKKILDEAGKLFAKSG